jgi:hypothetical protein
MPNLPLKSSIALTSWQSVMALKRRTYVTRSSERFSSYLSKSKPTISLMGFEGLPLS